MAELQLLRTTQDTELKAMRDAFEKDKTAIESSILGKMSTAGTGGAIGLKDGKDIDNDDDTDEEEVMVRRAMEAERDVAVKRVIQNMHKETIRLEREWRAAAEKERASVMELLEYERKEVASRQRSSAADEADLVVRQSRLMEQLAEERAVEVKRSEVSEVMRGVGEKETRLKRLKEELRAKQADKAEALLQQQLSLKASISEMNDRCESLREELQLLEKQHSRALDELKQEQENELVLLDGSIKSVLEFKDTLLKQVQEAIQVEEAKIVKLEKLIMQYKKPTIVVSRSTKK